jgi:hypothetical protein
MKTPTIALLLLLCLRAYSQEFDLRQQRSATISNVVYTITYELKSATNFWQPIAHGPKYYECTATVTRGSNRIGQFETRWSAQGCFDDWPVILVGRALGWERYPDGSAGTGRHWRTAGQRLVPELDESAP